MMTWKNCDQKKPVAPIRVLVVGINFSPEMTGIAPYTTAISEHLAEQGHTVTVITSYPHYPQWVKQKPVEQISPIFSVGRLSIKRVNHYVPRRPTMIKRIAMELTFGLRVMVSRWNRPDVVVSVSPSLIGTGMVSLRNCLRSPGNRRPLGVWVQDLYSSGMTETGMSGSTGSSIAKLLESAILRSATKILVIHERFSDILVNDLACSRDRIAVVRNWTHVRNSVGSDITEYRKELGWAPSDLIVLHAGNMGMKQGLENVVRAASVSLDRKLDKVKFVLVGDGGEREKLELMAAGLTNIVFVNPVSDAKFMTMLRSADMLVVNEREGVREMAVPSKLTSYFSSGRPVICASDPESVTTREVSISGGGICVPAGAPELLVDGVMRLQGDRDLSDNLGTAGLAYSARVLSAERAISDIQTWVESLSKG